MVVSSLTSIFAVLNSSFGQAPKPQKVRDPVCGLMVVKNPELSITYDRQTYYFCSKADRDTFKGRPNKYLN
jgi:YHS domain-containing protein